MRVSAVTLDISYMGQYPGNLPMFYYIIKIIVLQDILSEKVSGI